MSLFKRRGVSLSQFVRGMVKSLTDGQQAIPHAREEFLKCHMEQSEDDDGILYKPKLVTVAIDEHRRINLPTYTLAQVNCIGISSATVRCSARIVDMKESESCGEMNCGEHHAVFDVQPAGSGARNCFELTINFEQRDAPESEARLINALETLIEETIKD